MAILAQIPGRAQVEHCAGYGCIHLTYRKVSLHFSSGGEFRALCHAWLTLLDKALAQDDITAEADRWLIELSYCPLRLNLPGPEAVELGQLLREADIRLRCVISLAELPDTEAWPIGSVYVPLPDFSRLPRLAAGIEE